MGAQFVSPSTRIPTSMSGSDSSSDTAVSQYGKPSESFWTTASAMAHAIAP